MNVLKVLATNYPSSPIVQIVLIVVNAVRLGHAFVEAIDLVAKIMKLKKDESRETLDNIGEKVLYLPLMSQIFPSPF